jgi:ATP-binding cassette subfamily F protein 3
VRDGRAEPYPGGFRDYERFGRAPRAPLQERPKPEEKRKTVPPGKDVKDPAVARFEEQRQAARAAEKKKRRIQELESAIATGEKELDALRGKLKSGPGDDWEQLAKMAQEEQALTRKVDSMLMEWARLSQEVS